MVGKIKFYEYRDLYSCLPQAYRSQMNRVEYYVKSIDVNKRALISGSDAANITTAHIGWEYFWGLDKKPYYNIYTAIIPMFMRIDLSKVKFSDLKRPSNKKALIINFPIGNKLNSGEDVQHLFIYFVPNQSGQMSIVFGVFSGEVGSLDFNIGGGRYENAKIPIWDIVFSPLNPEDGMSNMQELLERLEIENEKIDEKFRSTAVVRSIALKLGSILCLLEDKSELLMPQLLSSDIMKKDISNIQRLIEKAHKRGKVGWSVGEDIERIPGERRPHPALYWTGKGRKTPVIIVRKGCVVNRKVMETIPTGYMDDAFSNIGEVKD